MSWELTHRRPGPRALAVSGLWEQQPRCPAWDRCRGGPSLSWLCSDAVPTLPLTGRTRPHGSRRTGRSPGNPSEYLRVLYGVPNRGRFGGQWGPCGSRDSVAQVRPAACSRPGQPDLACVCLVPRALKAPGVTKEKLGKLARGD